jgi:VanZ family protein
MNPPSRRARRFVFIAYAILLATATHWPSLAIGDPQSAARPDLPIHVAAFGLLTALLIACAFFGGALSPRNILISTPIAGAYSALDEASQAIPILDRSVSPEDLLANLLGVTLAGLAALMLRAWRRKDQNRVISGN